MTYRQLSRNEIIQLGREMEDLARWEGARDFVSALYGLEARGRASLAPHQITISVVTVPLLHQGYEESVEVVVTDSENQSLPFDLSRYWWSRFSLSEDERVALRAHTSGRLEDISAVHGGAICSALRDLCDELLGITLLEHPRSQPPVTFTYVIDTPPSVSVPAVYALE
jgi:hypothetical protein